MPTFSSIEVFILLNLAISVILSSILVRRKKLVFGFLGIFLFPVVVASQLQRQIPKPSIRSWAFRLAAVALVFAITLSADFKGQTNSVSEAYATMTEYLTNGPVYVEESYAVTPKMNARFQFRPNFLIASAAFGFLLGALFFSRWLCCALLLWAVGAMTGVAADALSQIAFIDALLLGTVEPSTNDPRFDEYYFYLSVALLVWLAVFASRLYPPSMRTLPHAPVTA